MTRLVLSLGANLGDPVGQINAALRALASDPDLEVVAVSDAYATDPVGRTDQPSFVNVAALVETTLTPIAVLRRTQAIEDAAGRVRVERWGPRTLDIDLITVDGVLSEDPVLTLPHPRAQERAFVLIPWIDVDADGVLPGHGRVADVLAALPDQGVRRLGGLAGWS